ncbi:MAG TPA: NAD(P)H-hydrate dehydratase [Propionibacteriaceae bacterium]|nr:NAD(P)H-hydrate dehydratase [Propionibacteriaceae bacterium]
MLQVHTADQVRAADAAQIAVLPEGELMQRAAHGLAEVLREELAGRTSSVLLLVGPGNNGGDALYAGALLASEGVEALAWRATDTCHMGGWESFVDAGGREVDRDAALALLGTVGVVVDGVYGVGARAGLPAPVAEVAHACRAAGVCVVAVDMPSGLEADSCLAADDAFTADRTVTFGTYKRCQVLEPARSRCGVVTLVDIGLEPEPAQLVAWERADVAAAWPYPDATSDKYARGVVGIDTGSPDYPGAGVMSTLGAVYAGAGMVRSLGAEAVFEAVTRVLPNVVRADGRVQAWLAGSGWGSHHEGRLAELLETGLPMVVDADALSQVPQRLNRADVLLTPHAGELARLLGTERPDVTSDPVTAVRLAVKRFGTTVLLKGATQYVGGPGDERVHVAVHGPAWTAQAGSGDVLAGICSTLLAAGLDPVVAAVCGASVQAMTAAAHPGPYPPQDMARMLPETIASLRG